MFLVQMQPLRVTSVRATYQTPQKVFSAVTGNLTGFGDTPSNYKLVLCPLSVTTAFGCVADTLQKLLQRCSERPQSGSLGEQFRRFEEA
jgi:hypothetical protein